MSKSKKMSAERQFLQEFVKHLKPYIEGGEDFNGADAVDWLSERYFEAEEILKHFNREADHG